MSRKIEVQILGDSKSLEAALGRSQQKTSRFGKGLAVASKIAGGALIGLGIAAKIGFDEVSQSQKVMEQTKAVLHSTGGVANVTSDHVNTLAQSLLNLSGVDDETIASGENMLLTFRGIRNEAGKGNDIFDQATRSVLDLSVAMGTDMKSAALQVGKALNDPVKGLTALKRVGVQFTDAQTKLIAHLVKTGHTMEAQKIILGELHKEFGGSAKAAGQTLAGQLNILREHFADVAANLVTALLPALNSLIGVLTIATAWMTKNQTATKILVGSIAALSAGVLIAKGVYAAWGVITDVVTAGQWLLNAALDANPVVLITAAVIGLGVALVIAYKKSETFRNIVNKAFAVAKRGAEIAWDAIQKVWHVIGGPLVSSLQTLRNVAGKVLGFLIDHWKIVVTIMTGGVVGAIILVLSHMDRIRSVAGKVLGFFKDRWNDVVGPIQRAAGFVQSVIDKIQQLIGWISRIHWPSPPSWVSKLVGTSVTDLIPGVSLPGIPGVAGGGGTRLGSQAIVIQIDGREIYRATVNQDKIARRQTGRSLLA